MMQVQKLSTLMGLCCLLLAVSGWLLRAAAFMHTQLSAFADTVPRMPHACEEMSAVSCCSKPDISLELHALA